MPHARQTLPALLALAALLFATPSWAAWQAGGNLVVEGSGPESVPEAISDGRGGTYLAWRQTPLSGSPSVRIQHLGSAGEQLWPAAGRVVAEAPTPLANNGYWTTMLVPDGAGGMILGWYEPGGVDLIQRYDANGRALWAGHGLPILKPELVLPLAGGDFMIGYANGTRVLVQRYSASTGLPVWPAPCVAFEGVAFTDGRGAGLGPRMVPDGAGGAILTWFEPYRIPVQRISADGAALWSDQAATVAANVSSGAVLAEAGPGSVFVLWYDFANQRAMIERVRDAVPEWANGSGVELSALGQGYGFGVYPDDADGAWVAASRGFGSALDLVVQHVVSGVAATPISVGSNNASGLEILHDAGGMTWVTSDEVSKEVRSLTAIRVDADGSLPWGAGGTSVASGPGVGYTEESGMHQESDGGVFVSWLGFGSHGEPDVYALSLDGNGQVRAPDPAEPAPGVEAVQVLPNPARGGVTQVNFALARSGSVRIDLFDLAGRSVRGLLAPEVLPAGPHGVAWDGRDDSGASVRAGIYFARIEAGDESTCLRLVVTR
jgi:hypothetical protein